MAPNSSSIVVHNCGTKQFIHDMNILTNDPQTQAFSRPCYRLCVSLLQWSLCVIPFCGIKQFISDMNILTDKRPTNTSLFPSLLSHQDLVFLFVCFFVFCFLSVFSSGHYVVSTQCFLLLCLMLHQTVHP